jgi:hypothetical protein
VSPRGTSRTVFLGDGPLPPAAAERVARASARGTSPRKTRVGGCPAHLSGRISRRGTRNRWIAPGGRGGAAKTASGRSSWPTRDPIGESPERDLYAFCRHDVATRIDIDGRQSYKVQLDQGEFSLELVPKPFPGPTPALSVPGVETRLRFDPNSGCRPYCARIRLVQVWNTYLPDGKSFPHPKIDQKFRSNSGQAVDFLPTTKNCVEGRGCSPYYNGHFASEEEGSSEGSRINPDKARPASLYDWPQSLIQDEIFKFETCAICEGSFQVLGCLKWGFQLNSPVSIDAPQGANRASLEFQEAVSLFSRFYGTP